MLNQALTGEDRLKRNYLSSALEVILHVVIPPILGIQLGHALIFLLSIKQADMTETPHMLLCFLLSIKQAD